MSSWPAGSPEAELWAAELAYWRHRQAGDVAGWLGLMHPDFVGWPTGQARPRSRAEVQAAAGEMQVVRDTAGAALEVRPLSVSIIGRTGLVYYELRGPELHLRYVHTWLRTSAGWRIAGGMSAPF